MVVQVSEDQEPERQCDARDVTAFGGRVVALAGPAGEGAVSAGATGRPSGSDWPASPLPTDPWYARLGFYVLGDTAACTRLLVLVATVVLVAGLWFAVAPMAAATTGGTVVTGAGVWAWSCWRRSRRLPPDRPSSRRNH